MYMSRVYEESAFAARVRPEWLAVASSLWLRASFAGASALASGLVALFNGGATPLFILLTIAGGGGLAAFALRRARQGFNRLASPAPRQHAEAAAGTFSPFRPSTREASAR